MVLKWFCCGFTDRIWPKLLHLHLQGNKQAGHWFTCNLLTSPAMFQPKIRSKYQGIQPWQGDFHEGNVFSSENSFSPDLVRKSDISSASLTQSFLLLCLQSWSLQCIIDNTAVLSLCLAFVNAGVRLGCNWHCIGGSSPCPHWCTVQSSLLAPPGRGLTACLFLPAGILLQALVFCVIIRVGESLIGTPTMSLLLREQSLTV